MAVMHRQVSQRVLEDTPMRALRFLRGLALREGIRAALSTVGFHDADMVEGWDLLHAASGFQKVKALPADEFARTAMRELDSWDEDGFRLASAALKRRFPAQHAFLFRELAASTGASAVLGVRTFLERLDALESAADRAATRQEDLAALEQLARRGINSAERARLRSLVEAVQKAAVVPAPTQQDTDAEHLAHLVALRGWYEEWTDTARSVIKRRDHLILLGLASRRAAAANSEAAESDSDSDSDSVAVTPVR